MLGPSFKSCFCSVDGVDFVICEPSPFNSKWFFHKHKGPGLRYEVAIGMNESNAVWASGPFACGSNTDLMIFRRGLKNMLRRHEKVLLDDGYRDTKCIRHNDCDESEVQFHSRVRSRHGTFNQSLRNFSSLRNRFRHNVEKHYSVFYAVLRVVQIDVFAEHPLFTL